MSSELSVTEREPSWRKLLLGFVLLYLLALVVLVPASLVFSWIEDRTALSLPAAQGSLWHGQLAAGESFRGVQGLTWDFSPQALLRGRLGYELEVGQDVIQGQAGLGADGNLYLDQVRIDGRLGELIDNINGMPLMLDVQLNGLVNGFAWGSEGCEGLQEGRLLIDDWQGMLASRLNPLQGVQLALSCRERRLTGVFTAGRAEAGLSGQFSLTADGRYQLEVEAKPQTEALNALFLDLGFASRDGSLRLQRQGRLAW
ncbi:type II secretion system protein N [Motiliproteus sp. SC1-56]|uniref:type II secretion system protein N n=1 Tax=Motiliproteus sp. SC1-56 TaxID=2799565 RepID=UPI001A8E80B1|nr:type II secretion system protein N [Motiliproteus sp. SC1-56]